MSGRLLQMSGIVVDFAQRVERLPASGEEIESRGAELSAGGGFNAMAAARRLGAEVAYGGSLGTGPFAEIARASLAAEGISSLQTRARKIDQGVCLVLIEPNGERTFVSHHGAERAVSADDLAALPASEFDWILLSGYGLYHPLCAEVYAGWLQALPRGPRLMFDPGPVVADIAPGRLKFALARADWISANRREAQVMTGQRDPARAAEALADGREGALVRDGAAGCWLASEGRVETVDGFAVDAIDTTGAGDAHDGAFIAARLEGQAGAAAARFANAAAAISITRSGPATAPQRAEVLQFLCERQRQR